MLYQWLEMISVILGPTDLHPYACELSVIVKAADEVITRLRAQDCYQPDMPADLI